MHSTYYEQRSRTKYGTVAPSLSAANNVERAGETFNAGHFEGGGALAAVAAVLASAYTSSFSMVPLWHKAHMIVDERPQLVNHFRLTAVFLEG